MTSHFTFTHRDAVTLNDKWGMVVEIVTGCLDILCPIKVITIREDQPDWFDGELRSLIDRKCKLYKNACISKNLDDWTLYTESRKQVCILTIKKKRSYIMSKLYETKNTPKKFWKEIQNNLSFGKLKTKNTSLTIYAPNKTLLTREAAANEMNTYYVNMGKKLAEKFTNNWDPHTLNGLHRPPDLHFRFIGEKETISLIKSLKINKSTEIPDISMPFLKDALLSIVPEIMFLLNECLQNGIMPYSWKIGHVTPIPKTAASHYTINYRPISVLPAPSKIIERAVYNQIVYHLETYGLLDCRQHGFRRGHSTCSAIHTLVQDMYVSNDNREIMSCVFIDYSKAFDTIDHNIFCKKLEYYGMGDDIILWCKSYLSHRKQAVKNGDFISDLADISCGVPQGSILGPLFFIIYVNDIMKLFDENGPKILLYADDTVLYYSHTDVATLYREMNNGLDKIWEWCKLNKLSINAEKTKYMILDPYNLDTMSDIKLGASVLEKVKFYNYLGVILDDVLLFERFMKEKCRKINLRIYQLGKMRKYIDSYMSNIIYKQTIVPLFDYADFLIESGPIYYQERLKSLHEKAVVTIEGRLQNRIGINGLELYYRLQSPRRRRMEHHSAIMYRLSKKGQLLDNFRPNINLRSNRKIKFKIRRRNMQKFLKSPMSRGIKIWNRIPQAIQRSVTKVKFKNDLKRF